VRRWISRFNHEGPAGLADRSRSGRPRLGGRRLTGRIAALLARPGFTVAALYDDQHPTV
jgi:transposase